MVDNPGWRDPCPGGEELPFCSQQLPPSRLISEAAAEGAAASLCPRLVAGEGAKRRPAIHASGSRLNLLPGKSPGARVAAGAQGNGSSQGTAATWAATLGVSSSSQGAVSARPALNSLFCSTRVLGGGSNLGD